jgi:mono/diheme cytochrome c family protein
VRVTSGLRVETLAFALVVSLAIMAGLATVVQSEGHQTGGDRNDPGVDGAAVFAANCAVCHGATGLGLAEAKEAFPADHRQCHRCHKAGNPPIMSLIQIEARQHDLFSLGEPPALRGENTLAATADPAALRDYLQTTMPRYQPGTLTDAEYVAVTDFLLQLNGRR